MKKHHLRDKDVLRAYPRFVQLLPAPPTHCAVAKRYKDGEMAGVELADITCLALCERLSLEGAVMTYIVPVVAQRGDDFWYRIDRTEFLPGLETGASVLGIGPREMFTDELLSTITKDVMAEEAMK